MLNVDYRNEEFTHAVAFAFLLLHSYSDRLFSAACFYLVDASVSQLRQ